MPDITNPHDLFIKKLLTRPMMARDFIHHYAPPEIVAQLNLRTLEVVKGSFIHEELQEHFSDLIFRVRFKRGDAAYIYILVEHKSNPDALVMWQLLRYMVRAWEQEIQNQAKRLPPIFPIILYHGRKRWNVNLQFSLLIDFGELEELRPFVPEFRGFLCDISERSPQPIRGSVTLQVWLELLKNIFSDELAVKLQDILKLADAMPEKNRFDALLMVIYYLASAARQMSKQEISKAVESAFPKEKEILMPTAAEEWVKEGREIGFLLGKEEGREAGRLEGRQEGEIEITLRLIQKKLGNLSARTQSQIRALPLTELERLSDMIFDLQSMKELQNWLKEHSA